MEKQREGISLYAVKLNSSREDNRLSCEGQLFNCKWSRLMRRGKEKEIKCHFCAGDNNNIKSLTFAARRKSGAEMECFRD